jgi:hypothetical protein
VTAQTETDFDGCYRKCRTEQRHTMEYGGCEHADKPEPTVSMSKIYTDTDGFPAIGFDTYTVPELAELLEPALRRVAVRLGPNSRALLERGETVGLSGGEYADLAREAAHAIVHRNDAAAPAVPAGQAPDTGRAAVLEEAADRIEAMLATADTGSDPRYWTAVRDMVHGLRYMATEAPAVVSAVPEQADEAPFIPHAHYRRDDGVDCCVHTIPVGPDSCPACRELADDEPAPPREPHPTQADLDHALTVFARFHGRGTEQPAAGVQQPKEA